MPKASRQEYADATTGEAVRFVAMTEAELRAYSISRNRRYQEEFIMGMQNGITAFALSTDLTDGDKVLLFRLLGLLDYHNDLDLQIKEVAEEMHRSRESVSRSIKRLTEVGALHRGRKVGRSYTYRLSPALAFKGDSRSRNRVEREIRQQGSAAREREVLV